MIFWCITCNWLSYKVFSELVYMSLYILYEQRHLHNLTTQNMLIIFVPDEFWVTQSWSPFKATISNSSIKQSLRWRSWIILLPGLNCLKNSGADSDIDSRIKIARPTFDCLSEHVKLKLLRSNVISIMFSKVKPGEFLLLLQIKSRFFSIIVYIEF